MEILKVRKRILCIILLMTCLCMSSCKNKQKDEKVNWAFSEKTAIKTNDDGWVYSFSYMYFKDESHADVPLIPCAFMGINLRYRYDDAYTMTIMATDEEGKAVEKTVPQTTLILGNSNSPGIKNDMDKIAGILKYKTGDVTPEELLKLTVDDISFEEFDENIFINLIQTALRGDAHAEGNYCDIPSYALFTEPRYRDNYKFQIGFINFMGCIDVIFIDVLYKTGDAYNDYEQLSDIVEAGKATDEQNMAYKLIKEISDGIVQKNDLTSDAKKNKSRSVAGIDFSRLYSFLKDVEDCRYEKYIVNSWSVAN